VAAPALEWASVQNQGSLAICHPALGTVWEQAESHWLISRGLLRPMGALASLRLRPHGNTRLSNLFNGRVPHGPTGRRENAVPF
jgi:hypothetical protein